MADPKIQTNSTTLDSYSLQTSIEFEEKRKNSDPEIIKDSSIVESIVSQDSLDLHHDSISNLFQLNKAKTPFSSYEPPGGSVTSRTFTASGMSPAFCNADTIDIYQERMEGKKKELLDAISGDPHNQEVQKKIADVNNEVHKIQSLLSTMKDLNDNHEEIKGRIDELKKV